MRDSLELFLNGNHLRLAGDRALGTLSDFLREDQGLIGTKIVCAEGDCGACSVLIGRPSADVATFDYQTIDACIVFMHQLDKTHVVTVEGLSPSGDGELSAIQRAMVDCHGSQCGFCTPGFVVAMHGLCEENFAAESDVPQRLSSETLRIGLSGNLCRCTGYVQIIQAGRSIDASRVTPIHAMYPPQPMHQVFASLPSEPVRIDGVGQTVLLPQTIAQAIAMKVGHPEARFITGATDVGVWYNHGRASAEISILLTGLSELRTLEDRGDRLLVGAGVTWADLIPHFRAPFPEMAEILLRFGSPQIRNIGTIGGNLINASPIADAIPCLMAIDACLTLRGPKGTRRVPINGFYHGYKETDLRGDELIESIECPKLRPDQRLKLYKISKRRDMDISTFTAAILLTIDERDVIGAASVALGGVGPTVLRVPQAEASLIGQPWSLETMRAAGQIARREISAITDVRASSDYREQLTENIFVKCFYDLTSPQQVDV